MGRTRSRDGATKRRRKHSGRKPRWLLEPKDLDAMAQRRCLMILSVLSGESSVEEAAARAEITPPLYYLLEKRGLQGMLTALLPGAPSDGSAAPALKQLQARIEELEKTKRRLERLLFLTRMTVKPGAMTQGPKKRRASSSTKSGSSDSMKRRKTKGGRRASASTPTPGGETALSSGSGS